MWKKRLGNILWLNTAELKLWLAFCVVSAIKTSDRSDHFSLPQIQHTLKPRGGTADAFHILPVRRSHKVTITEIIYYTIWKHLHTNPQYAREKKLNVQIETLAFLIDSHQLWTIISALFNRTPYCTTFDSPFRLLLRSSTMLCLWNDGRVRRRDLRRSPIECQRASFEKGNFYLFST